MLFNSTKAAFGRHETFALRYSWLTKGYQVISAPAAIQCFLAKMQSEHCEHLIEWSTFKKANESPRALVRLHG